ncbi:MAG: magnesium transporter CorA family protein [Megasphaera micronuciformis]|mgnify:FL=1|nr:magnesium transporter CorA family protein [Megasphaera micronuciformis]
MLEVFKHNNGHLEDDLSIATAEKGSWINVVNPDSDDLQIVSMVTEIPTDVLKMALDTEERSRVEIEDDYVFVVINIPIILETDSYDTLPLGVFITPDFIVTVCLQETDVMKAFTQNKYPLFYTFKKTRFLFQILFRTATLFLRYLQQINHRTDDIESILRHSMRNREFFMLLELQKSLTFFASALRGNGAVMEKLLRLRRNQSLHHLLKLYEEDEDLLEDVIIENKQAIEMVEMYSNILMNMSDTFASIISNNLNIVMKFLASITIILSVPTTIFSLWGVNVPLPFQENEWGFFLVITIAMISSAIAVALLWMKKLF